MIEVLLEADRALSHGLVDRAERLYRQVAETDPRSSIALVGLARVALERDDPLGAYLHARRALAIDPENPAASHMVMRMTEVLAGRGEAVPDGATGLPADDAPAGVAAPDMRASGGPDAPTPQTTPDSAAAPESPAGYRPPGSREAQRRPGLIGRLFRRRRR